MLPIYDSFTCWAISQHMYDVYPLVAVSRGWTQSYGIWSVVWRVLAQRSASNRASRLTSIPGGRWAALSSCSMHVRIWCIYLQVEALNRPEVSKFSSETCLADDLWAKRTLRILWSHGTLTAQLPLVFILRQFLDKPPPLTNVYSCFCVAGDRFPHPLQAHHSMMSGSKILYNINGH